MKSRTAALAAAVAALLALAAAGTAATPGHGTFIDTARDGHGAPDLRKIVVGDDPATGVITIAVTAVGYHRSLSSMVKVYLDADENAATGSLEQAGSEYQVAAEHSPGGWSWFVDRWNGSKWVLMPQSRTMAFDRVGDLLTWTVSRHDLGGTTGFRFWAWSTEWDADGNLVAEEHAPDEGMWSYRLATPPPVAAVVGTPATTPPQPAVGKRFWVAFPVTRSDDGEPLAKGRMVCEPTLGALVLPHRESFRDGTVRLSFVVPAGAAGRVLRVRVTILVGSRSTTRVATFRVP